MNILVPQTITASMLGAGTNIPVVDSSQGEELWVSGTNYTVGLRRVWDGYTHECVREINSAPQNTYAPTAKESAGYWEKDETAPTNRMAPFDEYLFTKARRTGAVTYVINSAFPTGFAIHGIEADTLQYAVKYGGVDLFPPVSVDMWQQAFGPWEYLFGDLQRRTFLNVRGIPLRPAVEIYITASRNDPDQEAAIGYISVGQWQRFSAPKNPNIGAARPGAEATPKSYSYFKDHGDGTYTRRKGRQAINVSVSCLIAAVEGVRVRNMLERIQDIPVAVEVSSLARLGWLNTVGFVTGTVRVPQEAHAITTQVDFQIKGNP